MLAVAGLLAGLALPPAGASPAAAYPSVSFAPCPAAPAPASTWNFTGGPSLPGALQWGGNASLCLAPLACASADGAQAALAPCAAAAAACSTWAYDTYTTFTLTNAASGNELTSGGAGGAAATVSAPSGAPQQQFIINQGEVSPASDSSLCLTAVRSA